MPCETCGHTMARLGCQYSECAGTWACPRCGTLKVGHEDGRFDIVVPSLVGRCREFYAEVTKHTTEWDKVILLPNWHRLGIAESIYRPEERPQPAKEPAHDLPKV